MGWFSKKEPVDQAKVQRLVKAHKANARKEKEQNAWGRRCAGWGYPVTGGARQERWDRVGREYGRALKSCSDAEFRAAQKYM